jgi:hypothetical protein
VIWNLNIVLIFLPFTVKAIEHYLKYFKTCSFENYPVQIIPPHIRLFFSYSMECSFIIFFPSIILLLTFKNFNGLHYAIFIHIIYFNHIHFFSVLFFCFPTFWPQTVLVLCSCHIFKLRSGFWVWLKTFDIFDCLACFTYYDNLHIVPSILCKWDNFILTYGWIILYANLQSLWYMPMCSTARSYGNSIFSFLRTFSYIISLNCV